MIKSFRMLQETGNVPEAAQAWLLECASAAGLVYTDKSADIEIALNLTNDSEDDVFKVVFQGRRARVSGSRPRALLYGIDACLGALTGVQWFDGKAGICEQPAGRMPAKNIESRAAFRERSLSSHVSLGPDAVKVLIHNRFNGISFYLPLLLRADELAKQQLAEAEKYDLDVTVGGHIVSQLVPAERYFDAHPDYFALVNGRRIRSGHLCYSNPNAAHLLVERIVEQAAQLLARSKAIKRFSIWSEDSAVTCECPNCRKRPFNDHFSAIVQHAGKLISARGIPVRLEFIIYNALCGRERNAAFVTLAPPERMTPDADCLLAYWGRDYSRAINEADNAYDLKGRRNIEEAAQRCRMGDCALRLFEYYADIWQLGDLFPFLGPVIWKDIRYYHELGVKGFWLCIAECPLGRPEYPVRELEWMNLAFAGRAMWDPYADYHQFLDDYLAAQFGAEREIGRTMLARIFSALAPLSWLNLRHPVPGLAGARLWHMEMPYETFTFDPASQAQSDVAERHRELYFQAIAELERLVPLGDQLKTFSGSPHFLVWFIDYCLKRLRALSRQLEGQDALHRSDPQAMEIIRDGLCLDAAVGGLTRKEYEEWLKTEVGEKYLVLNRQSHQS